MRKYKYYVKFSCGTVVNFEADSTPKFAWLVRYMGYMRFGWGQSDAHPQGMHKEGVIVEIVELS